MVGEVFINGKDAQKEYGVSFGADSFTALLTPAPVKSYIENKSALSNGKEVLPSQVKVDERDVNLTFFLRAKNLPQFLDRYNKFVQMLSQGMMEITTKYQQGVVYRCNYLSCSQFTQFNGKLAKFILKLNEPNPRNREAYDGD